ncbi:MAG: hypothetical protein Q6352_014950 [Candidatus Freyrarchaeum guaymaensis]
MRRKVLMSALVVLVSLAGFTVAAVSFGPSVPCTAGLWFHGAVPPRSGGVSVLFITNGSALTISVIGRVFWGRRVSS